MKYKKRNISDVPYYEAGEDEIIDIPDEEIETFMKKRLGEIINNPRLFNHYKSDIMSMLDKDIQRYAEDKYFSQEDKK